MHIKKYTLHHTHIHRGEFDLAEATLMLKSDKSTSYSQMQDPQAKILSL